MPSLIRASRVFQKAWRCCFGRLKGADRFGRSCLGPSGEPAVQEFWEFVSNTKWAREHPVQREPDRLRHSVPATLFGDDARVWQSEKILVLEVASSLEKPVPFCVGQS
eukprot:12977970-Alexandrium_andersonii.AAC.2